MNKNEATKAILRRLPEDKALAFFYARPLLMALAIDQPSPMVIERLNKLFHNDPEVIEKMTKLYQEMANTFFTVTERASFQHSVTSERSLLGYLTDGESHLKIYPNVDFSKSPVDFGKTKKQTPTSQGA